MRFPIRVRLAVWYAALLAAALLVFSAAVYAVMAGALLGNLDGSLRQHMHQVDVDTRFVDGRNLLPKRDEPGDVFAPTVLLSPTGGVLQGSPPHAIRTWIAHHPLSRREGIRFYTVARYRLAINSLRPSRRLGGYILVWQSMAPVQAARGSLLTIMLALGPAVLVLAVVGGLILAGRALRPVAEITDTAAAIARGELSRRVPVGRPRDELRTLALTFNLMIDRLAGAMDRERRFTADASHELRAPLAVIRAGSTLALERQRSANEYHHALTVVDHEAAALEELLASLLALARDETAEEQFGQLLVREAVSAAESRAVASATRPDVTVETHVDPDLVVEGSGPLLTGAVQNVLDNALRFSRPGTTVRIEGHRDNGQVVLTIVDEGPGIPESDLDRIFQPFYQAGTARTPDKNHGLGLAISRSIVEAHRGAITVTSAPGHGATFRIVLPSRPS